MEDFCTFIDAIEGGALAEDEAEECWERRVWASAADYSDGAAGGMVRQSDAARERQHPGDAGEKSSRPQKCSA